MNHRLILATRSGLVIARQEGADWRIERHTLADQQISSVIARQGVIIAGTPQGLLRSEDWGQSWQQINRGLDHLHVRWLAFHPEISDLEFAGTEPAAIFVSENGGDSWRSSPQVEALREKHGWWLPYSPEAGCVRDFAFHSQRGYAAVEVGGLLRSDDGGRSWRLATGSDGVPQFRAPPAGFVHPDVHSTHVHPSSQDLVFAFTNSGTFRSQDGGDTWSQINADGYTRAGWVDPADPDHLLVGPARSVGSGGTILETRDGGASWRPAANGLEVPWPNDMVERFYRLGETLLAVTDNGHLFAADLAELRWRALLPDFNDVQAVTSMAGSPGG